MFELSPEIVQLIIMAASTGQFAMQLIEETFSGIMQDLSAAKKQIYSAFGSGAGALTTYLLTQEGLAIKTAGIVFLSGVFATTALKLLKKKNEVQSEKLNALAHKVDEQKIDDQKAQIELLQKQLAEAQQKQS